MRHISMDRITVAVGSRGVKLEAKTDGVLVTLIDFTLSRLQTGAGLVAFCDLEADPALFTGPKGDCQVVFQRFLDLSLIAADLKQYRQ